MICSKCGNPPGNHVAYHDTPPPDAVEAFFPDQPQLKGWYCDPFYVPWTFVEGKR